MTKSERGLIEEPVPAFSGAPVRHNQIGALRSFSLVTLKFHVQCGSAGHLNAAYLTGMEGMNGMGKSEIHISSTFT